MAHIFVTVIVPGTSEVCEYELRVCAVFNNALQCQAHITSVLHE
jgi:hypothetical protein